MLAVGTSKDGFAGILSQNGRAVRFVSNTWDAALSSASEQERYLYAVTWCVRKLRAYLTYVHFILQVPDSLFLSLVRSRHTHHKFRALALDLLSYDYEL